MGLQARLLRCIKELLLLPADLTLGEICRYELKHGFVHELTGLETRPTRAFCNVWVKTPFHWHGASGERSFPRLNQRAPSWQGAQAKSNSRKIHLPPLREPNVLFAEPPPLVKSSRSYALGLPPAKMSMSTPGITSLIPTPHEMRCWLMTATVACTY